MTTTLYRKYRPQFFSDIVGQDHVTKTLQTEITSDKVVHAYLFCGMRGIGKTTMARLLAKALNCQKRKKGQSEACGACDSCESIKGGTSLDLLEIDAASNRRIDDIREIKQHIPYGPISSHYKVVIIDEVHMLTAEAFNALLKTLEEPPLHTIFVLATTEVHKLPETIISRCQRFDFHKVTMKDLVPRLEKIALAEGLKVERNVLEEIARLAGGSSRDAESTLGKLLSLGEKKITGREASLVLPRSDLEVALGLVKNMVERNTAEALEKINSFFEEGGDLGYLHQQITELLRKLLLIKLGGGLTQFSSFDLVQEQETVLTNLTREVTSLRVQEMLEEWLKILAYGKQSEITQLPFELALVAICEQKQGNSKIADQNNQIPSISKDHASVASKSPSMQNNLTDVSTDVSLEQIQKSWTALIDKLKAYNNSLSFILSVAEPVKVEGSNLIVEFGYKLHLERVNNSKIQAIIEQALKEVLGVPLRFKAIVKKGTVVKQDDLLANVLSTFGGSVEQ